MLASGQLPGDVHRRQRPYSHRRIVLATPGPPVGPGTRRRVGQPRLL